MTTDDDGEITAYASQPLARVEERDPESMRIAAQIIADLDADEDPLWDEVIYRAVVAGRALGERQRDTWWADQYAAASEEVDRLRAQIADAKAESAREAVEAIEVPRCGHASPVATCTREPGHPGPHHSWERRWDDEGMQVDDADDREAPPAPLDGRTGTERERGGGR